MPSSKEYKGRPQFIRETGKLIELVLEPGIKTATKYLTPKLVMKATYRGPRIKAYQHHVVFTIGSPNYAERQFIKDCKKADVQFPVKKIQLRMENKSGHKNNSVRQSSRRRKNNRTKTR